MLRDNYQQLQELCSKEFEILKEELKMRDEENKILEEQESEQIQELTRQNQKLEKDLAALTKDYFAYRIRGNDQQRQQQEENELQRLKNTALAQKLIGIQCAAQIENETQKEIADKQTEQQVDQFRNQIKTQDESITIIKN